MNEHIVIEIRNWSPLELDELKALLVKKFNNDLVSVQTGVAEDPAAKTRHAEFLAGEIYTIERYLKQ